MASKQALFFVACVLVGHTSTLAFTSPSLMRVAPSMPTKHRHFNAKSNVNPTFYGNRRDFSVLFEASAADESKSSSSDDGKQGSHLSFTHTSPFFSKQKYNFHRNQNSFCHPSLH